MTTLTYDPTPADQPEFNEAEQEAIAIGEAALEEQQAAYAGKFKDAEELEKAYIELQKKLGENNDETEELRDEEETAEEEVVEEEVSPAIQLITQASDMFAETGELTAEMMDEFSSMSSQDLVNAYMEMQGNLPTQQAPDLTEGELNAIKNSVGGENNYNELIQWAGSNMDPADIEAFDSIIDVGDARAIRLAVAGLRAEYEAANGYEGEMLTGRAPSSAPQGFRSQAEVVAAMQDPRYDTDPAYRQDVFDKLANSNVEY